MANVVHQNSILEAMLAAGFTTHELEIISNLAFGTALSAYSSETEPIKQAADVLQFAYTYNLVEALIKQVLTGGAERPAFQEFLLGDRHMNDSNAEQRNYSMLRIESKIDQILTEQARQSAQIVHLAQQQTSLDQRLARLENGGNGKGQTGQSSSDRAMDRIMVIALAIFMAALFMYTVFGPK